MKNDLRSKLNDSHSPQNTEQSIPKGVEDTLNQYSGKNEDELFAELVNMRRSGKMDDASMLNMAKQISPFLSAEQQKKLFDLFSKLMS